MNETVRIEGRRLGRLPSKATRKALMFSDFFKYLKLPEATRHWTRRAALPLRSYGNLQYGDCTRAKQAVATTRMERLEQKRTVQITDEEVIRVYTEMSDRLYGGGDNGAYEDDALNEWRNPETTFRDVDGHPYTIDAYLRIDPFNHDEVKAALALSGAQGIAVCFNLPYAWADQEVWTAPPGGAAPIGEWMPGTWGGHSMWVHDYTKEGLIIDHTWELPPGLVTWEGAAIYMDEAHLVIDSVNAWRKRLKGNTVGKLDFGGVVDAVNAVSSVPIEKK